MDAREKMEEEEEDTLQRSLRPRKLRSSFLVAG